MKLGIAKKWIPVLLVVPWVVFAACKAKSPEEQVAEMRTHYTAELNGWVIREEPPPVGEPQAEGDEAEAPEEESAEEPVAAGEEALEGEGVEGLGEQAPAEPVVRDVILDIVIHHDLYESLPGITLDITHADAHERAKEIRRVWVDTSAIQRGAHTQVTRVLEGIQYEPGDLFALEIRHPVPPEELGEYQEFRQVP